MRVADHLGVPDRTFGGKLAKSAEVERRLKGPGHAMLNTGRRLMSS